jgi:hypothetical protein
MNRTLARYRNSGFGKFVVHNQKYAPVLFFIGGFIFDTLTLGRIDRTYDTLVLCLHMTSLSLMLYLYNIAEDENWISQFLGKYAAYIPLAIQFSFGGLSSAFVIYFFRSVSMSKTISFFILLVLLLFANELLKKRISNKYLLFSVYFFISFTFFAFMIPMFIKEMNTFIFFISGLVSLVITLSLIIFIYNSSPSIKAEVNLKKMIAIIVSIYIGFNVFYYFNLIPPVPLAMETGLVAHHVEKRNGDYTVIYEKDEWYVFWRPHHINFHRVAEEPVYVFTSIFAPTNLTKSVSHRWQWYNPKTESWEVTEDINFEIAGGRGRGFRGYTYKSNLMEGQWKVKVITEEELVIGIVDFEVMNVSDSYTSKTIEKSF